MDNCITQNFCGSNNTILIHNAINATPDLTLQHLNLGYNIIIDYHWPPSLTNIIGAALLVGLIICIKKYIIYQKRKEYEKFIEELNLKKKLKIKMEK